MSASSLDNDGFPDVAESYSTEENGTTPVTPMPPKGSPKAGSPRSILAGIEPSPISRKQPVRRTSSGLLSFGSNVMKLTGVSNSGGSRRRPPRRTASIDLGSIKQHREKENLSLALKPIDDQKKKCPRRAHSFEPETNIGKVPRRASSFGEYSKQRRQVTFSTVSVNMHPVVLGDNPSVSNGLPVTLGPVPIHCSVQQLDSYEQTRIQEDGKSLRRTKKELRMSKSERAQLLLSQGYSEQCFRRVADEVFMLKTHRRESINDNKRNEPLYKRVLKKLGV